MFVCVLQPTPPHTRWLSPIISPAVDDGLLSQLMTSLSLPVSIYLQQFKAAVFLAFFLFSLPPPLVSYFFFSLSSLSPFFCLSGGFYLSAERGELLCRPFPPASSPRCTSMSALPTVSRRCSGSAADGSLCHRQMGVFQQVLALFHTLPEVHSGAPKRGVLGCASKK